LLLTGGTEPGHDVGAFSHATGHRVDIYPTTQIDNFIQQNYVQVEDRSSDCSEQYMPRKEAAVPGTSLAGALFAREMGPARWDIQFAGASYQKLVVQVQGVGSVTAQVPLLTCGSPTLIDWDSPFTGYFTKGQTVNLSAQTTNPAYPFLGWTGKDGSTSDETSISAVMSEDYEVTARFDEPPTEFVLSQTHAGLGQGDYMVDDDVIVYLNGKVIYSDLNGSVSYIPDITFSAKRGDVLRVVGIDTYGVCSQMPPLVITRASDGAEQRISEGSPNACGENPPGLIFFDLSFTIDGW
jgi:hypothetical protein